jgi:glycosyltransferase involved in cell wall biosynthesis
MKVSVVTPAYNAERYLERTILSVLAQDYRPIEYIIVSDGSTDATAAIARRYESYGVKLLEKPNGGVSSALNAGIRAATGGLIGWIDSDNLFLPGSVRAAVEAVRARPDAAMIYGDVIKIDPNDTPFALRRQIAFSYNICLYGYLTITNSPVFVNPAYRDSLLPLDERIRLCTDMEVYLKMAKQGPVLHLRRVLGAYRVHGNSVSFRAAETLRRETAALRARYSGLAPRQLEWRHSFYKSLAAARMVLEGAAWCRIPPFNRMVVPARLPEATYGAARNLED